MFLIDKFKAMQVRAGKDYDSRIVTVAHYIQ